MFKVAYGGGFWVVQAERACLAAKKWSRPEFLSSDAPLDMLCFDIFCTILPADPLRSLQAWVRSSAVIRPGTPQS